MSVESNDKTLWLLFFVLCFFPSVLFSSTLFLLYFKMVCVTRRVNKKKVTINRLGKFALNMCIKYIEVIITYFNEC